jgi:hydroxyacylglutathione hydrolase
MGRVLLRFLETPGHTPESISILVCDLERSAQPEAVLTGDTLFIGDVGRPDLLGAVISAEELAGMLYDSLHGKLLALPDSVKVYPAHGAGSMCGRNISNERSSTIGRERQFNYALRPMPRDEFIRLMTVDLPERPAYFSRDAEINRAGPPLLDQLPAPAPLTPREVERLRDAGHVVVDTRTAAQYGTGHVPGSLNIGLGGQFASWAGSLISPDASILLVGDEEKQVREARTRLARVGLERVAGHLSGGVLEWDRAGLPLATTEQISVQELEHRLREPGAPQVVDVRRPPEWGAGDIHGALHVPLNQLEKRGASLDRDRPMRSSAQGATAPRSRPAFSNGSASGASRTSSAA